MANAKIALQLSTREGFEVKVSEALHAGIPVVASQTGGIPLQIQHGKSGYLCEPGDNATVAKYLVDLYTDKELYAKMSKFARENVSQLLWLNAAELPANSRLPTRATLRGLPRAHRKCFRPSCSCLCS